MGVPTIAVALLDVPVPVVAAPPLVAPAPAADAEGDVALDGDA